MIYNSLCYLGMGYVMLACASKGVFGDSNKQVEDIAERFFQWRLFDGPEYGTKYGIHTYDDRVQEFTEDAFLRQKNVAAEYLEEANIIGEETLTVQNYNTLQVLKKLLGTFINGYKYRKYSIYNNISPMNFPLDEWRNLARYMKFESEGNYRTYIARLKQSAIQIENITVLMDEAVREGTTQHKLALTGVIESVEAEINKAVGDTIWYSAAFPESNGFNDLSTSTKNNLTNALIDVITKFVLPRWQAHLDFLKNVYLPNTRQNIGVSSLPDGENYYLECLNWHLTIDLTPTYIYEMGLKELRRTKGLIEELMISDGFTNGSLSDYVEYLNGIPSNFYEGVDAGEQMLQGFRDIVDEAYSKMDTILRNPPKSPVVVMKELNPRGTIGRYRAPPLDNSIPGIFWANVYNAESRPKYNMIDLTLHEVYPGHHTDASYRLERDLPLFRRTLDMRNREAVPFNWLFSSSKIEGWASYAEALGEDMGMYKNKYDRFGKHLSDLVSAAALVVDTGIHVFNWTHDQAIDYLRQNTALSNDSISNSINRYIAWPGQACAYKVGELKMKELRQRAEEELGDLFDQRDFHHEVLVVGPVPLTILESHIDKWIAKSEGNSILMSSGLMFSVAIVLYFVYF